MYEDFGDPDIVHGERDGQFTFHSVRIDDRALWQVILELFRRTDRAVSVREYACACSRLPGERPEEPGEREDEY